MSTPFCERHPFPRRLVTVVMCPSLLLKIESFLFLRCFRFVCGHGLRERALLVGSVHFAKRVADFADCGVGSNGVDDEWHRVGRRNVAVGSGFWRLCGGFLKGFERAADGCVVATFAQVLQFLGLVVSDAVVDVENVWRLFFDDEIVGTDDDFLRASAARWN